MKLPTATQRAGVAQDTADSDGSDPPGGTGSDVSVHDAPFHVSASGTGEGCGAANWTDPTATQESTTGQDTSLRVTDVEPEIAGVLAIVHVPFASSSVNAPCLESCWPDG
jgi:hypothetical protein